jgi:hypothetical protein
VEFWGPSGTPAQRAPRRPWLLTRSPVSRAGSCHGLPGPPGFRHRRQNRTRLASARRCEPSPGPDDDAVSTSRIRQGGFSGQDQAGPGHVRHANTFAAGLVDLVTSRRAPSVSDGEGMIAWDARCGTQTCRTVCIRGCSVLNSFEAGRKARVQTHTGSGWYHCHARALSRASWFVRRRNCPFGVGNRDSRDKPGNDGGGWGGQKRRRCFRAADIAFVEGVGAERPGVSLLGSGASRLCRFGRNDSKGGRLVSLSCSGFVPSIWVRETLGLSLRSAQPGFPGQARE